MNSNFQFGKHCQTGESSSSASMIARRRRRRLPEEFSRRRRRIPAPSLPEQSCPPREKNCAGSLGRRRRPASVASMASCAQGEPSPYPPLRTARLGGDAATARLCWVEAQAALLPPRAFLKGRP
ncbi:hypothetical protein EJB05_30757 [Eragrostis curvula]|uniref:Uncharacterized protein n=1 Tax=Eragrostis curvula TaxID=38414 RepID=A0A5J9UCQ3_9POAL|nr:hypothetical protein EJB05_30757 [Eragrostis curvula]